MTKRAKTLKYASDDHADDLLADILDSTEDQARAEEAEIKQSLAAQREAEERARAEAHAARLAERQQKLERELERQAQLARRRTQKMEALKVVDEPEEADDEKAPVETTPSLDEAAIRRQIAEEVREELRSIGMTPMPEPQPRQPQKSRGMFAAAAAVLVAGGLAAGAFLIASNTYAPDTNSYSKAVFAPLDREAVALEMSATPIPKPEPVIETEPEPQTKKAPRRDRNRTRPAAADRATPKEARSERSVFGAPTKTSKERDSYDELKGMLEGGDDLFGDKN